MTNQVLSFIEVLSDIDDPRQPKGKRYSLKSILALAAAAMMCGYRSYSAIAEWGRNYGHQILSALGFSSGKTPCAATFFNTFRKIDKVKFEAKLAAFLQSLDDALLAATQSSHNAIEGVAMDGKTLRGSKKAGADQSHLLSAFSHATAITLAQSSVEAKSNEITAVNKLLPMISLEKKVITTDALLTQRALCEEIIHRGGHYLMKVKDNQPGLLSWVSSVFEEPLHPTHQTQKAETVERGHGRIESRSLIVSSLLCDSQLWPGLNQCYKLESRTINPTTGEEREEVLYGITSLSREQAGAERLMELNRGHWGIENKSHWVRDVTMGEDQSGVRKGSIAQIMAAMRNAVIGVMRWGGEKNIAAACRKFAARPWEALALIGIKT
jgi:predicted transposase YbfD/YdcC